MLIALHKGRGLISRLIGWQTRSAYTHASIVLDSGEVIEAREFQGVRLLPHLPSDEDIDVFEVTGVTATASADQRRVITAWLMSQLGKPYDYTMVARFVSRRQESRKSSGKWFCSELVFAALQKAGVNLLARCEPWEVSPALLSKSPLLKQTP